MTPLTLTVTGSTPRRYDIDALRVVGTLLVFLFHCIQPFNPNDQWHIQNSDKSEVLGYVITFFNIWVMPLFMLLAGSSSFYALKKRSNRTYLKERFTRIFIPLVFGILLVVPPQVYFERRFKDEFEGSLLDFYPRFFDGVYPVGNFSWHHLWFLAYLFVYSVVGLSLFRWLQDGGRLLIDRFAKLCSRRPLALAVFLVPPVIFHVLLYLRFPQTNALINDWSWHAQLFTIFVYGFILVSNESFLSVITEKWRVCLAIAMFLTGAVFSLRLIQVTRDDAFFWPLFLLKGSVYRSATWLWLLTFIGIGGRYLNRPSKGMEYFSTASYPFYILHQGVIVSIAFVVVGWSTSVFYKLTALTLTAFLGTALLFEFSRRVSLVRWLLGMKVSAGKQTGG